MICFFREINEHNLFIKENDVFFLNVLDSQNKIDLAKYIVCVFALTSQYENVIININSEMPASEKLKVVLSKNLSPKLSYMIS